MVKYEELSKVEKKWVDDWINGIAWFIAESPNESLEKTKGQYEEIKKILQEKRNVLSDKARKWKTELLKVFNE